MITIVEIYQFDKLFFGFSGAIATKFSVYLLSFFNILGLRIIRYMYGLCQGFGALIWSFLIFCSQMHIRFDVHLRDFYIICALLFGKIVAQIQINIKEFKLYLGYLRLLHKQGGTIEFIHFQVIYLYVISSELHIYIYIYIYIYSK